MRVGRFGTLTRAAVVGLTLATTVVADVAPSALDSLTGGSTPPHADAAPLVDSFPAAVSSNGRYLVDGDGLPYLVHGDSAWSLIVELNQSETRQYLDNRQAQGFNLLLMSVVEHKFSSNAPRNAAGAAPFQGRAFGTPNEAYFQHVDWVVAQAEQRGITLLFVPAYLGYNGGDEGWYSDVVAASNADMRAYGEFLGRRYRNAPNIIWAMGGDYSPPPQGRERMEALAAGLAATAPDHLMTAHTSPEDSAGDIWGGSSWLDIDTVYTYGSTADATAAVYGGNAVRPIIFLEGIYENEQGAGAARMRTQAWASLLSGASGQIFGNNPIWHFGSGGLYPTSQTWQQAMNGRGSIDMSHVRSLFHSLPWHRLQPDRSDRFLVSGEQSGEARAAAATVDNDGLALVFVPTSRTIRVDLARLSADSVRVRWYDPTNGSFRNVGSFAASGTRSFSTPGSNSTGDRDWVLVVDPSSLGSDTFDPVRMLDSRAPNSTIDGDYAGIGTRPARSVTKVQIAGRGNIPTNATSAIINLTIANPNAPGYATAYPCGQTIPTASNINYYPGTTIANAAITNLGPNGDICIYTHATTHLIVDASGSFPTSTQLDSFSPIRMLDSRTPNSTIDGDYAGIGTRPARSVTKVQIAGRGNIPTNATSAIINLTIANPNAPGYATAYPCGQTIPTASNINYYPGTTIANAAITNLGPNGDICIYTHATTHLIVDASGSFPTSTQLDSFSPIRMLDSRTPNSTIDGDYAGIGTRPARSVTKVQIAGRGNIPTNATSAIINLTIANPNAPGYATAYPCGQTIPTASNINYYPGTTIANAAITNLGPNGDICIYTHATTHLIVDASGTAPSD